MEGMWTVTSPQGSLKQLSAVSQLIAGLSLALSKALNDWAAFLNLVVSRNLKE